MIPAWLLIIITLTQSPASQGTTVQLTQPAIALQIYGAETATPEADCKAHRDTLAAALQAGQLAACVPLPS